MAPNATATGYRRPFAVRFCTGALFALWRPGSFQGWRASGLRAYARTNFGDVSSQNDNRARIRGAVILKLTITRFRIDFKFTFYNRYIAICREYDICMHWFVT